MSTFSESEHPRAGGGQFAAKAPAGESGVSLGDDLGGTQIFDYRVERAEREQKHAEWSLKNARLNVANAVASEVGARYPSAHSMVLGRRVDEPGPPRRLHAVRDANGADLWTYTGFREGDAMSRVSDVTVQHNIKQDVPCVNQFNEDRRMIESVIGIRAVREAHDDHKNEEPTR